MNKIKALLILSIFIFSNIFSFNITQAAINLAVSPIKYELKGKEGETITKSAKVRNPGNKTIHIITGKSDFVPNGENGVPRFIRKSEMVYPDQQLSEWINIDTKEFDIAPGETRIVNFDIKIPDNATPGGHYGAIFFKNNNSENSNGASVGINVDYGVLILLEVEGDIVIDAEIKDPIIKISKGGGGGNYLVKDDCPNGDNSYSYYDGTCEAEETKQEENNDNSGTTIQENENNESENQNQENQDDINNTGSLDENENQDKTEQENKENINNTENDEKITEDENKENTENDQEDKEDFSVNFTIPIDNKGNTHIKPKGKIILKDEDGNVLKKVGKEIIVNEKGAIIGEQIVDYIPINDIGGVVIPGSSRNFQCEWKGFPYRDYDEEGNPLIKYWSPDEYYSKQNLGESIVIMPWEQIKEKKVNKTITAEFNLKYKGLDGKDVEYNSAKEFPVEYTEKYVAINYYVLCPILALLALIFIFILIALAKRKKCVKCGKSIKKDMKVCPYCGAKQKKKK